ncbi:DinB family protein [Bacillus sp. CLL-7-23]|uniref:DinB family protein n=1 Tax=Bacillus changyiensis TaxID=3004103 RepID=A0ABT4XA01_9BACI|nr:DinB family protein [Bacillus changyiensis]MDA7028544.1 DinB family protein [Bacillus changyiensis]
MSSIFHEARKELWSEVQGLSDHDLTKRPELEEWSIQEVLDHLKKIDLVALQLFKEQVPDAPVKPIEEKPVKNSEDRRSKRKAPSFVEPERKTIDAEAIKNELDHVRTQLNSVISTFDKKDFQKVLPHPIFEELSVSQWIDFIGHHEIRHLHQIREIKEKLS